jgi:hypothetical protein
MRRAFFRRQTQILGELDRFVNPPPLPPEPEVIYVEAEQGIGRLGYSDFNAKLFASPLRWR